MARRLLALAWLAASASAATAADGLNFQPTWYRRMAVTDRSTEAGLQPRVWTVSLDGWLTSKRPDVNVNGWWLNACCVESGVDAVSWTDGATARQRVFFARGGVVNYLRFDGDGFRAWGPLPAPAAGVVFANTDVAALTWLEAGVRRVAVASISTYGQLCVWSGDTEGFAAPPLCSGFDWAQAADADVVGAVVANVPMFAYRLANGRLGATRPFLTSWFSVQLGLPPTDTGALRPSLAIYPSRAEPGRAEILVVGSTGRLQAARVDPLGSRPDWVPLPLLPDGATPSASGTAVAATLDGPDGLGARMAVYVASSSRRLFRAYSNAAGAWTEWHGGLLPRAAAPPGGQAWWGNGVAYPDAGAATLFGAGGVYALIAAHFTTQQFTETGFRDHLYLLHLNRDVALGSTPEGTRTANESTASLSPVLGIATAIRRNADGSPWEVVVSDTTSGGAEWSDDRVVQTAAGWPHPGMLAAQTDPYTAITSSGRFHHLALEVPLSYDTPDACRAGAGLARRLIHREGGTAAAIARATVGANVHVVAEEPGLDHGNLALTEDATGVTAHVVYTIGPPSGEVRHWWRTPAGATTTVTLPGLFGPPGVFAAANGDLYAYTIRGALCRLAGGTCVERGALGAPDPPSLAETAIVFGDPDPLDPRATCGGRRCFDTPQPIGFAAHPLTPRQIYAVYQREDPAGGMSVYFQRNDGGSLNIWTSPRRVHARGPGDTTHFVDPSITVDQEGTLIVTYTRADTTAPEFAQFAAHSTDNGVTWTVARLPVSWSPHDLPYHCSRERFFVGEYREGSAVGNRAFNLLHRSSGGRTVLADYWASRWSITSQ